MSERISNKDTRVYYVEGWPKAVITLKTLLTDTDGVQKNASRLTPKSMGAAFGGQFLWVVNEYLVHYLDPENPGPDHGSRLIGIQQYG